MIRPRIRLAEDADADAIQDILRQNDMHIDGFDWKGLSPYWLVAEHRGRVIGCAHVMQGKPFGVISHWAVLPHYQHSGAGIFLWWMAEAVLRGFGCQGYIGFSENPQLLGKLEEIGATRLGEFTLFVKRVS